MADVYRYTEFRVPKGGWGEAIAGARSDAGVIALFAAEIGAAASDGVLLSTDADVALPAEVLATYRLVPTARPTERPSGLDPSGVYAHRWFDVAAADVEEVVGLSASAWPAFEAGTPGTRIIGLFRVLDVAEPAARLLLLTYYPSLAAWESSRATEGSAREAFVRRHQLTESTIVRTYRLRV